MRLEVLVTTMNKTDDEIIVLYHKMHLTGPAIFGNQCGHDSVIESVIDGQPVKVVNQSTLGASRNRNAILRESTADLIVFMDDDIAMVEDYQTIVENDFGKHSSATSIRFNMLTLNPARPIRQHGNGLATYHDVISYGVWGLVLNRKRILQNKLSFNPQFGPGTNLYCGEDAIFTRDLLFRTNHNYDSKKVLGVVEQRVSTWYARHDDSFFISQGALYCFLGLPIVRWVFLERMLNKNQARLKEAHMTIKQARKAIRVGISLAKSLKG